MDTNFDQKFKKLPPHIQEWMAKKSSDINGDIAENYQLNLEDTGKMVWVISRTIIGDIKLEDFYNKLKENLPSLSKEKLKKLAIDIAIKRFYPIRDFLEGAEALIENLGGKIPEDKELFKDKYKLTSSDQQESAINDDIIYVGVGEILQKYPEVKNQFITSKPIKLKNKERQVAATYSNWTQDYRERVGAPPHSTVERSEYLFKSDNAKNLDDSERKILGNVLKAYDEGGKLPIDKTTGKLVLSELFHQGTQTLRRTETETTQKQPTNVVDLRQEA